MKLNKSDLIFQLGVYRNYKLDYLKTLNLKELKNLFNSGVKNEYKNNIQ
jgi:hypothetical protein